MPIGLPPTLTCRDGVFTARDARESGYDSRALSRLVAAGQVLRLARGVYASGPALRSRTPEQRHATWTRAMVRSFDGRAVASHASALALMGLPLHGADLSRVHLARTSDIQSRCRPDAVLHQTYGPGAVDRDDPDRVTPALALLGNAMLNGVESGVVSLDAALASGRITLEELNRELGRFTSWCNVRAARQAVGAASALSESVGESRLRLLLTSLGFCDLTEQAIINDPLGRRSSRVDFLLAGVVVIEFDGAVKYETCNGRAELVKEKVREDRLRSRGYEVVRLVWDDLDRPDQVRELVRAALARARR